MKNRKLLLIAFICLFLFVSCGSNGGETSDNKSGNISSSTNSTTSENDHKHNFSKIYEYDETSHWQQCECGEKKDIATHTYGEWITIKEATKNEKGSKKQVCNICGYENVESIPELSHTHSYSSNWYTNEFNHWYECECGEKKDLASHAYGEWIIIKDATENEKGSKKQVCSVCGYENTVTIPELSHSHNYSTEWYIDENNHWYECECGDKKDLASHTYGEWIIIKDATENEKGSKKQVCSVCGYENVEEINKLEHNYSSEWHTDENNHWHECECGDKKDLTSHAYGEWIIVKEATHTENGSKKQVCSVCGYENVEEINKLEHNYSSEWHIDENNHWYECECGDKKDIASHTYGNWEIVKLSTETETGLRKKECTICGYKFEEVIEIHEHSFVNGICSICGYVDLFEYTVLNNTTCKLISYNGSTSITTLEIPQSINGYKVVEIEKGLLEECEQLTKLSIPFVGQKLDATGNNMFEWIFGAEYTFESGQYAPASLNSVIVTGGNIIKEKSFVSEHIQNLYIASSITEIEKNSINCTNLKKISLPFIGDGKNNNFFGYIFGATDYENQKEFIPNNLSEVIINGYSQDLSGVIPKYSFYGCSQIQNITIPNDIIKIEESAFNNTSIKGISLGDKLIEIQKNAFANTQLNSIVIPNSVNNIGDSIFFNCVSLSKIELSFANVIIQYEGYQYEYPIGYLFGTNSYSSSYSVNQYYYKKYDNGEKNSYSNTYYIPNKLSTIILKGGNINPYTFADMKSLSSITIDDTTTSIGNYAFSNCTALTSISIPDNASIGYGVLNNCSKLSSISLPGKGVLGNLFNNNIPSSLKYVYINNTNELVDNALSGFESVEYIYLNCEIVKMGNGVFSGVNNAIIYASFNEVGDNWPSNWNNYNAYYLGYDPSKIITYQNVKYLVLSENTVSLFQYNLTDTNFALPNSITYNSTTYDVVEIGTSAFYNNKYLQTISINNKNNLQSVGAFAFYCCSELKAITFNKTTIEIINEYTFYNCTSLSIISIPKTIKYFMPEAFYNCKSLEEVYYLGSFEDWAYVSLSGNNCSPIHYSKNTYFFENSVQTNISEYTELPSNWYKFDDYCLDNFSGLTNIIVSNNVTSIGKYAFSGCSSLASITIPSSVTSIGSSAFSGCSSLESITLPFVGAKAGVTSSDTYQYSFGYIFGTSSYPGGVATNQYYYGPSTSSTTYSTYYIPSTLKSVTVLGGNILYGAFIYCLNITNITLQNSVTSIDSYAFSYCRSLTSITIPESVTSIGDDVFECCSSLTSIEIPSSVTSIGEDAFYGCSSLETITFAEGSQLTSIGNFAFSGCSSLTSISIPNSVTSIGSYAFYNCSSLISVYYDGTIGEWCKIPFIDYYSNPMSYASNFYILDEINGTIEYSNKKYAIVTKIEIPKTITKIGDYQFNGFDRLTSIEIPSSVTSIGKYAFSGCSSLDSMTIPFVGTKAGVTSSNIYQYPFGYIFGVNSYAGGVATEQYYYGSSTSSTTYSTYYIPSTLKSVTVLGGYINYGAFYNCSSLTSIEIPSSVTSIASAAFKNCSSLTSIEIPSSVTSIGSAAFENCSSLTSIEIPSSVTNIGESAFYGCSSLESVTFAEGSQLTSIGNSAFSGCSSLTSIEIPSSVTSIGNSAFSGCSSLTSIEIPSSVTSIGSYTFEDCSSLTSITIPSSVTSIGSGAFYGCSSLESITLPFVGASLHGIYNTHFGYIFGAGSALYNSLYVPISIKEVIITGGASIGSSAFSGCSNLTSIEIPSSVTNIGSSAFSGCSSLESMTIPFVGTKAGVTSSDIYQYPFGYIFGTSSYDGGIATEQYYYGSSTSSTTYSTYYIPSTLKSVTVLGGYINYGAFYNCSSLTSIEIPSSVTSIGSYAFLGCSSLTSIEIPSSVTSIGLYAFENCEIIQYNEYDNAYYLGNEINPYKVLVKAKSKDIKNCQINENTSIITYSAFSGCSSLESLTIPFVGAKSGVTSSDTYQYPFGYIFGGNSYAGGVATEQYYYGSSTSSRTYSTYYIPSALKSITVLGGYINYGAFYNCNSLTSITISSSVTSIASAAFRNCSSLASIEIPSSVTNIGESAFYGCSSLESVTFAEGSQLTSIGNSAFSGCSSLTSIEIPSSVTSIGNSAFSGCSSFTSIEIPSSVTSIGKYAFYNCSSLTSISIPNSVTSIGLDAFYGCSSLESITIPFVGAKVGVTSSDTYQYPFGYIFGVNSFAGGVATRQYYYGSSTSSTTYSTYYIPSTLKSVTVLGGNILYGAFNNCFNITTITIQNSVTSIDSYAFNSCSSLTSISIPNSVTSIGSYAFIYCSSLTSITIPSSVTSIGKDAFSKCSSLDSVLFEEESKLTNIGYSAFEYCSSLTSIEIPSSVTSIGSYAFYNCSSLASIAIPSSVTSIGSYAFYNCSSLTSVYYDGTIGELCKIPFIDYYSNPMSYASNFYILDEINGTIEYSNKKYAIVTKIEIPKTITKIGDYQFIGFDRLTSIEIPSSVTSIGSHAFSYCSSLTSITIPSSVTSIGLDAFSGCSSLESMTIPFVGAKAGVTSSDAYQYPFGYIFGTSSYDGGVATRQYYYGSSTSSTTYSTYYIPSTLKSVTVLSGYINYGAFYNCSSLTSIEILSSVTSIGSDAFYGCSSLTSITIPSSVTSIGSDAFKHCYVLVEVYNLSSLNIIKGSNNNGYIGNYAKDIYTDINTPSKLTTLDNNFIVHEDGTLIRYSGTANEVVIPSSVTSISSYAFKDCSSLTSIEIPSSVTSIGSSAFSGCSSLESMTIPFVGAKAGVTSSDTYQYPLGYIFGTSSYTGGVATNQYYYGPSTSSTTYSTYYIPSTLKSVTVLGGNILYGAFIYCLNITNITLQNSVTSIDSYAFSYCSSLTSITIPESVTSIGDDVFECCSSLTSIEIPSSVTSIGEDAFYGCSSLETITFAEGSQLTSIGNFAFSGCSSLTSISIPNSVTSIGSSAFIYCSSLTSITIPSSVTSIGEDAFETCYVLVEVYNLSSLNIIKGSNNNGYIGNYAKDIYTDINTPSKLTTLDNNFIVHEDGTLIRYSGTANEVVIPSSVISIGSYAFYNCSSLTSVTIPESVTSIGSSAFSYCRSLASIEIPSSVTSIDSDAFDNCSSLTSVYYDGTIEDWFRIQIYNSCSNPMYYASNFYILDEINGTIEYSDKKYAILTKIEIPNTINIIGDFQFYGFNNVGSITIPESVTSIGSSAFKDCSSLTSISIPNSVTSIGSSAFSYCSSLTSITIPSSVTSIGSSAFSLCSSLTSITIPSSVTSIGSYTFEDCSSLTSITIPSSVTSIGSGAFDRCSSLESVTFEEGSQLTKIGEYAFRGCRSLTSIEIPSSVTSIGLSAFYNCSSLTSITFDGTIAEWNAIGKGIFWDFNTGSYIIHCTDGDITKS